MAAPTLWACWTPPPRGLTGAVVVSFLSPSMEEQLAQTGGVEIIRAREASRQVRQTARQLYQELVARAGTTLGPHDGTLRQALARPGEASRWWYHPVSFRDCEGDPTFDRLIAILTIQAVASQRGLTHVVLCGAAPETAAVLRSAFRHVELRASKRSPPTWWVYLRGVGSRLRYAWRTFRYWLACRSIPHLRQADCDVAIFGFWDWSVRWDERLGRLADRYLKTLPDVLRHSGCSSVAWIVWCDPEMTPDSADRTLTDVLAPLAKRQDVVLLQPFLHLWDIVNAVGNLSSLQVFMKIRRTPAFRAAFRMNGFDYYPVFARPLLRGFLDASLTHRELLALAMERACRQLQPRVLLSFLEHFPDARACYEGVRRAGGETVCCAVQHASYNHEKTFLMLHPEREFFGQPDQCPVPHPDYVCAMGSLGRELFLECGYPDDRVLLTGSPRYAHVRAPSCSSADEALTPFRPREELRVLVALGLSVDVEVEMVEAVCAAVQGLDDVRVMVRNHPFSRIERHPAFTRLQPSVTITQGTLEDDLALADLVVFTYSTVAEEAFLKGKPVWQWLPLGFNGSALVEAVDIPQFGSVEALRRALLAYRADPRPFLPSATASEVALTRLFYQGDGGAAQRIAAKVAGLCADTAPAGPLLDGIPVLLKADRLAQAAERRFREAFAVAYCHSSRQELLTVVARHHAMAIMRRQVRAFHARFRPHEWILDLGTGFGWHWQDLEAGAKVLAVDFSLENLRLARRVLGHRQHHVMLVCADAALLPLHPRTIAGLWSVQAFQHFPDTVLNRVREELDRVLQPAFVMEITNVNPAIAVRAIYRLCGKRFHRRGTRGSMELNCRSVSEWTALWRSFRAGGVRIRHSYSELFFHPDLRLRPRRYPLWLERVLARRVSSVAGWIARQLTIRVESVPPLDEAGPMA